MNLALVYRQEVRDEIDQAYSWYEGRRAGLGEEFLAELWTLLDRIQLNPGLYALLYRDVRAALTRRFPYVVYYRIESNRIIVLAVQHGKQRPQGWRSRT